MTVKVMLHPTLEALAHNIHQRIDSNVVGFISWSRLIEALRQTNEFSPDEYVEAFLLRESGIQFYVRKR